MTELKILDVSHHQGAIDWPAIAENPDIHAVIVKLTEGDNLDGQGYLDPRARENWAGAISTGKPVGSYHFCRSDTKGGGADDGDNEAAWYCETIRELGIPARMISPAMDIERGGMDPEHSAQRNIEFGAAFEARVVGELGRSPMVYTGPNTWRDRFDWTLAFSHLPGWFARYASTPPTMPWPTTMWQYTGSGSVPGIAGDVDVSRFYGDAAAFEARLVVPQVWTPDQPGARGEAMPWLDLGPEQAYSLYVAQVQALLNLHGAGLVVDGITGPLTREAWAAFSAGPSLVVDWLELLGRQVTAKVRAQ